MFELNLIPARDVSSVHAGKSSVAKPRFCGSDHLNSYALIALARSSASSSRELLAAISQVVYGQLPYFTIVSGPGPHA